MTQNPTDQMESAELLPRLGRVVNVLLIKPYQATESLTYAPPLGLLYLASSLRARFADKVNVEVLDMKVQHLTPQWLAEQLGKRFKPDVVGFSALNCEANATHELAQICKSHNPDMITVLGGPLALHRAEELFGRAPYDWVFNGAAEYTFAEALDRYFRGDEAGEDLAGFNYRKEDGSLHLDARQDNPKDIDNIPFPAWDLVDFDLYARRHNMMTMLRGKRYATIFTSRGCPYLCNYCHDVFTKKFTWRTPENVIKEIELLYEQYGVDEFQIVDDIFNLHKPRVKAIMSEVARRWPGKLKFTFPNGLRGDILDTEILDVMKQAGVYAMSIAVETVTPRLQTLIEKDLKLDKTFNAINEASDRGMMVSGFFMLGFPTETVEEMQATVDFAINSRLTIAHFFMVVPQPETPLYDLALNENPEALALASAAEERGADYRDGSSWYQAAYGFDLVSMVKKANFNFYCRPQRIWRIWNRVPKKSLFRAFKKFLEVVLIKQKQETAITPGSG